jgi:hypothetical protein
LTGSIVASQSSNSRSRKARNSIPEFHVDCESVARLGQRCFRYYRSGAGEGIDRQPDDFTDAVLASIPEPGIGDADADAVDATRHAAQESEAVTEIGIERGEAETCIRHAARQDAGRIEREA